MRYHAERQANPEKYPDYNKQFIFYLLSQGKPFIPFNTKLTKSEKTLAYLKQIHPKSIHYTTLSDVLLEEHVTVRKILSILFKKGLVEKTERGIYRFKDIVTDCATTEGVD
ncbi:MAG: hypothetical protein H7646_00580 [Candidatus Heimdallarchaeota archaeon]|nr:hypothetical protein [Candidatus Heimdallarchaeota archaeon]